MADTTTTPPATDDGTTALGTPPEAPAAAGTPPPSDSSTTPPTATTPPETPPATPPPADAPAWTAEQLTIPQRSAFTSEDMRVIAAEGAAMGLTKEQTQAMAESRAEVITGLRVQWFADAQADPEIGGEKFPQAVQDAKQGMAWLFPKEDERKAMQEWFDKTAMGNHPGFIRAMARIGSALREDRPVAPTSGGGVGNERKSSVDVLWPSKT